MNCDPNYLMQQAKCYQCIPKGMQGAVMISLLCEWANHLTPPPCPPITWSPPNLGGTYNGGIPFADLAAFLSIDPATVTTLDFGGILLTDIQNLCYLPNLQILYLNSCSLGPSLDLSHCVALTYAGCDGNAISSVDITGCVSLQTFTCNSNYGITTITGLNDCAGTLIWLDCGTNSIANLNLSGFSNLQHLDVNSNQLGTLTITGDFAITYLDISGNPAVVVIGP